MQTISELLLKYPIPGVQQAEIRRVCAEEISQLLGYPLTSRQIKFKDGELFLSVPSVVKSALVIRQNELISQLASRNITLKKLS